MSCIKGALDDTVDNQILFNYVALLSIFLTLLSCFVRSKFESLFEARAPCTGIPRLVFCYHHVVILYAGEAANMAIWTE